MAKNMESNLLQQAVKKLERFRVSQGLSVSSLYGLLNRENVTHLNSDEFASILSEICNEISDTESFVLADAMCRNNLISAGDFRSFFRKNERQFGTPTVGTLLKDHPIFPDWLASRDDFKSFFCDWNCDAKRVCSPEASFAPTVLLITFITHRKM